MLSDQFSPSASLIANPAESRWNHEAQATTSIQHLYANCSGLRAAVSAPQSPLHSLQFEQSLETTSNLLAAKLAIA